MVDRNPSSPPPARGGPHDDSAVVGHGAALGQLPGEPGQWIEVNRLLAAARSLPAAERLEWLERLDPRHAALKPTLRVLLARSSSTSTDEFAPTLQFGAVQGAGPAPGEAAPAGAAAPAYQAGGDAEPVESDFRPGEVVGRYRLLRQIGSGGMGEVWLAQRADQPQGRAGSGPASVGGAGVPAQFAVKLPRLLAQGRQRRGLEERMARERDILAALDHPHIAPLYDAGVDAQGRPYLAMGYVKGVPIDTWCTAHDASIDVRLKLLLQVARAVAHAHARGVLHRDLKPGNVLVTPEGSARLLDFGIAKIMTDGQAEETMLTLRVGRPLTPDYSSPEQIFGEPITPAADVYSFGVMSYELLTGQRPYRYQRARTALLQETLDRPPTPPASQLANTPAAVKALKGDLDAILAKALEREAAQRYPTIAALVADLKRHLSGRPVQAVPDSLWYRLSKLTARDRLNES